MTTTIDQRFPHRLVRDPSVIAEIRQGTVYTSVPFALTFLVWLRLSGRLPDFPNPEAEARWALAVLVGIAIVYVWVVALKVRRALSGRIPIVEVDEQPWRPGGTGRARIYDRDPAPIEEWDVRLVANGQKRWRGPGGSRYAASAILADVPLMALSKEQLGAAGPIDRVVKVALPQDAARPELLGWRIAVRGRRGYVLVREDFYAVKIETGEGPRS